MSDALGEAREKESVIDRLAKAEAMSAFAAFASVSATFAVVPLAEKYATKILLMMILLYFIFFSQPRITFRFALSAAFHQLWS